MKTKLFLFMVLMVVIGGLYYEGSILQKGNKVEIKVESSNEEQVVKQQVLKAKVQEKLSLQKEDVDFAEQLKRDWSKPTMALLEAKDMEAQVSLIPDQLTELCDGLGLLTPVTKQDNIPKTIKFPYYELIINSKDTKYNIIFLNQNILAMKINDTFYNYFRFNGNIYSKVTDLLPVDEAFSSDTLQKFFQSEQLEVKVIKTDESYVLKDKYRPSVARVISTSQSVDSIEVPEEATLQYELIFSFPEAKAKVLVYENFFTYEDSILYCKGIGQSIRNELLELLGENNENN